MSQSVPDGVKSHTNADATILRCAARGQWQHVSAMTGLKSLEDMKAHILVLKKVEVKSVALPKLKTKSRSGPRYDPRIASSLWCDQIRQRIRALNISLAEAALSMGKAKGYIQKITGQHDHCGEAAQKAIEEHIAHLEAAEAVSRRANAA